MCAPSPSSARVDDEVDDVAARADDAELRELDPVVRAPQRLHGAVLRARPRSTPRLAAAPAARLRATCRRRAGRTARARARRTLRPVRRCARARRGCWPRAPAERQRDPAAVARAAPRAPAARSGAAAATAIAVERRVLGQAERAVADVHLRRARSPAAASARARLSASSGIRSIECTSAASSASTAAA